MVYTINRLTLIERCTMPWKESSVMEERMKFVSRLLEGEEMTLLCQEFGISRTTGYKIYDRYKEVGVFPIRGGAVDL